MGIQINPTARKRILWFAASDTAKTGGTTESLQQIDTQPCNAPDGNPYHSPKSGFGKLRAAISLLEQEDSTQIGNIVCINGR